VICLLLLVHLALEQATPEANEADSPALALVAHVAACWRAR
jgi:hypothetical protein